MADAGTRRRAFRSVSTSAEPSVVLGAAWIVRAFQVFALSVGVLAACFGAAEVFETGGASWPLDVAGVVAFCCGTSGSFPEDASPVRRISGSREEEAMEQVTVTLPYAFVAPKMSLTWQEVRFGIDEGLFSPSEAIDLAADSLASGNESAAILDLAAMGRDDQVASVVAELAQAETPEEIVEIRRLWAFLVLAWVFEHREKYRDPLDLAEQVYADLDYPQQVAPLIRYTPSDEPDLGNPSANEARLLAKWGQYLVDEGAYFASRKAVDD